MTTPEAVGFLTKAAWKEHKLVTFNGPRGIRGDEGDQYSPDKSCKALKFDRTGSPKLGNERLCDCGANLHNATVKEALMTIGGAAAAAKRRKG